MSRVLPISLCVLVALALPASARAAMPPGFVGITSEDTFAGHTPYREANLAAQRRAGVQLLRQTFDWAKIEYRPETYDWSIHDQVVLIAARNGILVLPLLFNAPPWHSSRPAASAAPGTYPPRSPASMARFTVAAVARYGPRGTLWRENPTVRALPIRAWQVWNEPNLPAYWGGRPDASAYVQLLKAVNGAVKRVDRGAEIVTAGLPPSTLPGSVPLRRYLTQMYRSGGARHFDTLALNTYARSASELGRLLDSARGTMDRGRDRRAGIWITELGWCDTGPPHRFCVGASNQARLIASSIALVRRNRGRLRLRGFVYYSWRDAPPYAPDFRDLWGLHTGLLRVDGHPKPAYSAFTAAVRQFR